MEEKQFTALTVPTDYFQQWWVDVGADRLTGGTSHLISPHTLIFMHDGENDKTGDQTVHSGFFLTGRNIAGNYINLSKLLNS